MKEQEKISALETQVAKLIKSNNSLRGELKRRPKIGSLHATNLTPKQLAQFCSLGHRFEIDEDRVNVTTATPTESRFLFKDPRDPNNFPFYDGADKQDKSIQRCSGEVVHAKGGILDIANSLFLNWVITVAIGAILIISVVARSFV